MAKYFDILKDIISKRDDIIPVYTATNDGCKLLSRSKGKYEVQFKIPKGVIQFEKCLNILADIEVKNYKISSLVLKQYLFFQLQIKYCKEYNLILEDIEIKRKINIITFQLCKALKRKINTSDLPQELFDFCNINMDEWSEKIKHNYFPFIKPIRTDWANCILKWEPRNGLVDQLNLVLENT